MKIHDDLGLPAPLLSALHSGAESFPDDHIRVTELIDPPMIRYLRQRNGEKIVENASERIWAMVGTIGHRILQDHTTAGQLAEKRLKVKVGPWTVTGKFDLVEGTTLNDWKMVSLWSCRQDDGKWGPKPEWVWQTNIYRRLLKIAEGIEIDRIRIVALLRDWSKLEAIRNPDMPQAQVFVMEVPIYPDEKVDAYLQGRVEEHLEIPRRECTPQERWEKPDTWAVKKPKRLKALRVYDKLEDAEYRAKQEPGLTVEHRKGKSVRCESYCAVRSWCPLGRKVTGMNDVEEV